MPHIQHIDAIRERLAELVEPKTIPAWLEAPNPVFGGRTPQEIIARGEIDRLWTMIFYLESGIFS